MAQPTRSDDQVVRRRLSHNNLRRKKWRRRQPRAERKRPRRSGSFSALNLRGARRAPHFFIPGFSSIPQVAARPMRLTRTGQPTKRGRRNAGPTCQAAECAGGRTTPQSTSEGRNPQWRRRRRAERRRRRRRGKFAAWRERGRIRVPFFVYSYRKVVPSQICTRRITSPGSMRSTSSMPFTTRPNVV
jgi:hypothetical protein